jgi:hypothetical protein
MISLTSRIAFSHWQKKHTAEEWCIAAAGVVGASKHMILSIRH